MKGTAMRSRPALTLDDVKKMAAAAEAAALANEWNVAIAIVDDGGHLLAFLRMDGATPANAQIAAGKAVTAACSRRPTQVWEQRIADGRLGTLSMPLLSVQGGLPVVVEGTCIGGIGVSGVQSHEDEQIARAGLASVT